MKPYERLSWSNRKGFKRERRDLQPWSELKKANNPSIVGIPVALIATV
jgi:hypothetical protein